MRIGLRRISSASKLTVLLIGLIIIWGAIQIIFSLLDSKWLQALSNVLVVLILILVALKIDSIGRLAQKNNLQIKRKNQNKVGSPTKNEVTATSAHHHESPSRLKTIGLYTPEVIDTKAKGRQAAAVSQDPLRSHRLYAAIFGLSNKTEITEEQTAGRTLAVVGSDGLTTALRSSHGYAVQRLLPGLAKAQIDASTPSAVILEEAAFNQSPWATSLDLTGTSLLKELLDVLDHTQQRGVSIYVLESKKKHRSTMSLRSKASLTFPSQEILTSSRPDGSSRPVGHLLSILNHYAQENK